ncbi:hypothetical protein CFOL_v3_15076 [Cephalotus follicularis]|uniref:RVT_2 domain-containing protein n=1 Tax=Cephalotus follicularis TaxID=3775 RepID=A0A1Q3BUB6_CEPFO|nr:hypothetical protein CFOL_v3_15076 [Cephalotus follicularis]
MLGSKPVDTPMDPNVKLTVEDGEPLNDPEKYRRLVRKLNYLTVTRPDIAFSISVVSQFLASPKITHWNAVIRILRYLKGNPGCGLVYRDYGHRRVEGRRVEGFSDADWAGSPVDRRSITGY